jgi:hypothetical protein
MLIHNLNLTNMTTKLTALIIFLTALSGLVSFSQVTDAEKTLRTQTADTVQGWKTGGVLGLNLAQTSLTNWAAGGQNSVAFNGIFSVHANLVKEKSRWDNSLDVGYGLLKQGKNSDSRKTDDKFDFLSKYGQEAFKNFYYAVLFNFKTQMAPGYNYPDVTNKISDLLAPAYVLFALGMDYKPNPHFSAFIAPVTSRTIIVRDQALADAGAFGVEPGKKSKSEFGGYLRAIYTRNDFKSEFLKNVSFTTKINLFSNYADKPQNLVVNWETLIALKVNKYISANLNTQLIYDDKVKILEDTNGNGIQDPGEPFGPRVQFKEILGVGFSYNF